MRYWVYINNEVLPQPYEAEDLSSIPGFDAKTLICPEETPEGETQEWTAAGDLINYGAPVQPSAPETKEDSSGEEQEIYDASGEYTPEPLPDSYGKEDAEDFSRREKVLLDKIEYLINEVSELKKDIANLNYTASMSLYNNPSADEVKYNVPLVKDDAALKAFQEETLIPINENDIPEEEADAPQGGKNESDPVVIKASADDNLPKDSPDDDILESAIENTMRLKAPQQDKPAEDAVPLDLASKDKTDSPSEKEEEDNSGNRQKEAESADSKNKEPEPSSSEQIAEDVSREAEILEVAAVGTNEEEEILKSFAAEKQEEEKKKAEEEAKALEEAESGMGEAFASGAAADFGDSAAGQPETAAGDGVSEQISDKGDIAVPEDVKPQEENLDQAAGEPEAQNADSSEEEKINSLQDLTGPSAGEEAQPSETNEQEGTVQVDSVDDKFLKTFTSSIEEVFLDQPTSIISDYVPPSVASHDNPLYEENASASAESAPAQGQSAAPEAQAGMEDLKNNPAQEETSSVRQVKRIKPAAIKTVPMVAAGDPIGSDYNTPNIEEAIAELSAPSPFMKGLKAFALMIVLLCAVLGFVAILAVMGILPKEMSPIHYIIDKVSGPKVEQTLDLEGEMNEEPEENPEELMAQNIINTVKNYTFVDGSTLEAKINAAHNNNNPGLMQWSAEPSVDPSYYSIAVKLPPNKEGYSLTYRFSYNISDGSLTPTTSESNNIMAFVIPRQAASAQTPQTVTMPATQQTAQQAFAAPTPQMGR